MLLVRESYLESFFERSECIDFRRYGKILVPFDGTLSTEETLRLACRTARWHGAQVLVVVPFLTRDEDAEERNDFTAGVKLISRQEKVEIEVLFQDGRPSDTIIDVSYKRKNDLIVFGTTEMSALERFVIGSITARIIGHAKCDMIVAPENRLLRWKRILLCTDGSKYSYAAENNAIAYAQYFKGEVSAVSVVDMTDEFSALCPTGAKVLVDKAAAGLDRLVKRAKGVGVPVAPLVRAGDPILKILEAAKEIRADVIVMGSHERVWLGRLFFGSVAKNVAMNADCPVFIFKP